MCYIKPQIVLKYDLLYEGILEVKYKENIDNVGSSGPTVRVMGCFRFSETGARSAYIIVQ